MNERKKLLDHIDSKQTTNKYLTLDQVLSIGGYNITSAAVVKMAYAKGYKLERETAQDLKSISGIDPAEEIANIFAEELAIDGYSDAHLEEYMTK